MTEALLVRHGQSKGNIDIGRFQGRSNHLELTPTGERQASLVGPWLKCAYGTPDAIVASPAVRTRRTAEIALEAAGLQLNIAYDGDLQELSRGDWEGELYADMITPELRAEWTANPMTFRPPNGESRQDGTKRELRGLNQLPEGRVWVFGHGLVTRLAVGAVLGWNYETIEQARHQMYNTSLTEANRYETGLHIGRFAMAEHLPADLLTV